MRGLYLVCSQGKLPVNVFLERVEAALDRGTSIVQFREKEKTDDEFVYLGSKLGEFLSPLGVPLIYQ